MKTRRHTCAPTHTNTQQLTPGLVVIIDSVMHPCCAVVVVFFFSFSFWGANHQHRQVRRQVIPRWFHDYSHFVAGVRLQKMKRRLRRLSILAAIRLWACVCVLILQQSWHWNNPAALSLRMKSGVKNWFISMVLILLLLLQTECGGKWI